MVNYKVGAPDKSYDKWEPISLPSGGQIVGSGGKVYNIDEGRVKKVPAAESFFRKLLYDVAVVATLGQAKKWRVVKDLKWGWKEVYFVSKLPESTPVKTPVYIITSSLYKDREVKYLKEFYPSSLYELHTVISDGADKLDDHQMNALIPPSDPTAPKPIVAVVLRSGYAFGPEGSYGADLGKYIHDLNVKGEVVERVYYIAANNAKNEQLRSGNKQVNGEIYFIDAAEHLCRSVEKI